MTSPPSFVSHRDLIRNLREQEAELHERPLQPTDRDRHPFSPSVAQPAADKALDLFVTGKAK